MKNTTQCLKFTRLLDIPTVIALFAKNANAPPKLATANAVFVPRLIFSEWQFGTRKGGCVEAGVRRVEETPNLPPHAADTKENDYTFATQQTGVIPTQIVLLGASSYHQQPSCSTNFCPPIAPS